MEEKKSIAVILKYVEIGVYGKDINNLLKRKFDASCEIRPHDKDLPESIKEYYKGDKLFIVTSENFKDALVYVLRERRGFQFVRHAWIQED